MTAISHSLSNLSALPVTPGNAQHIGRRDSQQDAFGFSNLSDHQFACHAGYVAVLADGMGGMQNGVWASTEAVRTFLNAYRAKTSEESVAAALHRSALSANDVVHAEALRLNLVDRMGSTLVAAVIHDLEMYWINIGDSRAYLFDGGQLFRLSTDHNFSEVLHQQVIRGEIDAKEAMLHPMRNALTSYVGREQPRIDASTQPIKLRPGAWILLCSDGLSGVLSEQDLASELHGIPQEACERLINAVNARRLPQQDNTTIVVLHVPTTTGNVVSGYAAAGPGHHTQPAPPRPWRRRIAIAIGATALAGAGLFAMTLVTDYAQPTQPSQAKGAPVVIQVSPDGSPTTQAAASEQATVAAMAAPDMPPATGSKPTSVKNGPAASKPASAATSKKPASKLPLPAKPQQPPVPAAPVTPVPSAETVPPGVQQPAEAPAPQPQAPTPAPADVKQPAL